MSKEHNIPTQKKGAQTDTSEEITLETPEQARQHFELAKQRLLQVSNWDKICGKVSAKFQLTDSIGNEVRRLAQTGDYFRIDIPGPGNQSGDGYDWVQIEHIDDSSKTDGNYEYLAIKVRPASNPKNASNNTSHFFKDDATSTFLVQRTENTVRAEVHGRNETPNTGESDTIIDTLRNAVIAVGAMFGISTPQWKSLVKGLVSKKD